MLLGAAMESLGVAFLGEVYQWGDVWRKCDQLVSHSCSHSHAVPATRDPNSVALTMSQNKLAPLEFALGAIAFYHCNKNVAKTRNG